MRKIESDMGVRAGGGKREKTERRGWPTPTRWWVYAKISSVDNASDDVANIVVEHIASEVTHLRGVIDVNLEYVLRLSEK